MRFSTLVPITVLAAVAAAAPGGGSSQCNTGSTQCCTSTYSASSSVITSLLSTLGIALPDVGGLVGLGCTPITVVGTGSSAECSQQPVCCTGNTYNGLINVGCSPINLNL